MGPTSGTGSLCVCHTQIMESGAGNTMAYKRESKVADQSGSTGWEAEGRVADQAGITGQAAKSRAVDWMGMKSEWYLERVWANLWDGCQKSWLPLG